VGALPDLEAVEVVSQRKKGSDRDSIESNDPGIPPLFRVVLIDRSGSEGVIW
jgi:hypothetical protein